MRFTLEHEDRLVLLSDGIVEAMDANGQLFGFERIQTLLNKQVTAIEVAGAAQNFGQQDDISVITVARTAVLEPALV
jgi:serine phosphatase RsbU (regulator of sigma subunit)